jgi:hypothetical protein
VRHLFHHTDRNMGPGSSNNHRAPVRNSDRPISFKFKSYSIHSVITTTSKFILVISKLDCLFSGLSSSLHIFLLSRIDECHMIIRIRTTDAWGVLVLHKMEVIVLPALFYHKEICTYHLLIWPLIDALWFPSQTSVLQTSP